ncbi:hypothetical protein FRC02_001028, partial [Tulasnella sp. 418]
MLFSMSAPTLDYPHVPSPSHLSEKLLEVDNTPPNDHTPQSPRPSYYGPRRSLGFAAFLPFATVLLWAFGLGSGLLIWLLVNKLPAEESSSPIFHGYLVVNEGNKTSKDRMPDGQVSQESTLRGVLLVNLISTSSNLIVVPLMALGAFHVAAKWLDDQALSKEGPTPFQFGLVMQMCSSGNLKSVLMTLLYLFKRQKSNLPSPRSHIPPVFYRALSIAGMVVILHYTVIITNLVLTADIGTAYYPQNTTPDIKSSPDFSNLGTQYNPQNGYWEWVTKYLEGSEGLQLPGPWDSFSQESLETVTGYSVKNRITVVNISTSSSFQDAEYMAVIIRPPSPATTQSFWTAPTLGMKAQCQPVQCTKWPQEDISVATYVNCPKETSTTPYHKIPLPTFNYMTDVNHTISRYSSTILGYSPSNGEKTQETVASSMPQFPQLSNPSYFFVKLLMPSDNAWSKRRDTTELGSIQIFDESVRAKRLVLYLGACEVTMYHVQVSFNASARGPDITNSNAGNYGINHQYTLASSPIPMTPEETTQVLLPTYLDIDGGVSILEEEVGEDNNDILSPLKYQVVPSVALALLRDIRDPGFSTKVSSELARQALAFIAGMNVTTVPATSATDHSAIL